MQKKTRETSSRAVDDEYGNWKSCSISVTKRARAANNSTADYMEKQLDRDSAKNLNFFIIILSQRQQSTLEVQHPKRLVQRNQQQHFIQFNLLLKFLLTIA